MNSSQETAIHEAGHAVLMVAMQIGIRDVSIVACGESLGEANHTGSYGHGDDSAAELAEVAYDSFLIRHAIADYAGAEALRHSGCSTWKDGAQSDFDSAVDRVNEICGDDEESCKALFAYVKRRCAILVDHYFPEIEAVAVALVAHSSLSGENVRQIFLASTDARCARMQRW